MMGYRRPPQLILISIPGEPFSQQAAQLLWQSFPATVWMKTAAKTNPRATEDTFIVVRFS